MQQSLITGRREAISNWLRRFTTTVDPEKKLFRESESLLGIFQWGNYKTLPKIDYVLVFRNHFAKCEACTFDEQEDSSSAYYQVSLVHHKTRRIVVQETHSLDKALQMAKSLSASLQVGLKNGVQKR